MIKCSDFKLIVERGRQVDKAERRLEKRLKPLSEKERICLSCTAVKCSGMCKEWSVNNYDSI